MSQRRHTLPAYCERVPNQNGTFTITVVGESRPLGSKRVVARFHEPSDTTTGIVEGINHAIDLLTLDAVVQQMRAAEDGK